MKTLIIDIHRAFENKTRLGIMSVLAVNATLDFNTLKDYLNTTDGKLATHIKALEKDKFIGIKKSFVGKKPNTKYFMTKAGRKAFLNHLDALERLVKLQKQ